MAVAFQDDFESVQNLAEQMIYKDPIQPPEPVVEDGELIEESDSDGLNHKQYKSPLECGFKQTETKPAIFYKMLSDDDIRMREQVRKQRRDRIGQEVGDFVKIDSARPLTPIGPDHQRRRFPRNEIELKERRMRDVIFRELSEMWRTGHFVDRPEHVHPFVRGDSGEFSEESALRRRLFRGCFREFVNDCRNKRKIPHVSLESYQQPPPPPPPYAAGGGGLHYNQRLVSDLQFRVQSDQRHHPYNGGYQRHGVERQRSVLESVTWTAEEVRLYYECMAKYNVRPVLPIRQGRMDSLPHQPVLAMPFLEHARRRHYDGTYGGCNRVGHDRASLEPETSPHRLTRQPMMVPYRRSLSPQPYPRDMHSLSSTSPSTSHEAYPSQQLHDEDVPKMHVNDGEFKRIELSPADGSPQTDLSPQSSASPLSPPIIRDHAAIFVDELLNESVQGDQGVHSTNGETEEIDLYNDL